MSQKVMIFMDDCGWCPDWLEKFKDQIETDELKVVNLTDSQQYIDIAADLKLEEYPSIVEIFDDGNACLLDDDDWNKTQRCINDRCDIRDKPRAKGKEPVEI